MVRSAAFRELLAPGSAESAQSKSSKSASYEKWSDVVAALVQSHQFSRAKCLQHFLRHLPKRDLHYHCG